MTTIKSVFLSVCLSAVFPTSEPIVPKVAIRARASDRLKVVTVIVLAIPAIALGVTATICD